MSRELWAFDPRRDLHPPRMANAVATEKAILKEEAAPIRSASFSFMGNARSQGRSSRAKASSKLIAGQGNRTVILGRTYHRPRAGDLIHEVCVAMGIGASAEVWPLTLPRAPDLFRKRSAEAALGLRGRLQSTCKAAACSGNDKGGPIGHPFLLCF